MRVVIIIPPSLDERRMAFEHEYGKFDLPCFGLIELRGARIFYTTFLLKS